MRIDSRTFCLTLHLMKRLYLIITFLSFSLLGFSKEYNVYGPQGGLAMELTLPDGFNEEIQGTEAYPEDAVFLLGHVPVLQDCRHVEQDERGR